MRVVNATECIAERVGMVEGIQLLKDAGFDAVDMSFFEMTEGKGVWCTGEWKPYAKMLRAAADEMGLPFSQAHAPFPSSQGVEPFDTVIVERILRSMEVASILGVKNIVVHPKQHLYYPEHKEELFEMNVKFYKELLPHAERLNLTICTENMWMNDKNRGYIIGSTCADPDEFCAMIDAVDNPHFKACLDVGHSALAGWDIPAFIKTLGKERLACLHIHDVSYVSDDHTLPFQRKLPWEEIMAALAEIGYENDFTFEANNFIKNVPVALLPASLKYVCETGRYLVSRIEANK